MRRIISALVVCAAVGASAAPASADNSGTPPGPPAFNGGLGSSGAFVVHCKVINGSKSVAVFNRQGRSGGGSCFQA